METLFYWTLGIAMVLLAAASILLLMTERKKQKSASDAFRRAGAETTEKINDLWIDRNSGKWLIARECETPVHALDQVVCAELTEDGVRYIWQDGEIRSAEGDQLWPVEDAPTASSGGFFGNTPKVSHIYLNIFTREATCPVETLVLLTRPCARTSRGYRTAALKAGTLMKLFNTIQPANEKK